MSTLLRDAPAAMDGLDLVADVLDATEEKALAGVITWSEAAQIFRAAERACLEPEDRILARDEDRELIIAQHLAGAEPAEPMHSKRQQRKPTRRTGLQVNL